MDETPNASKSAPTESKLPSIIRALGIVVLVLILCYIDKLAVGHLPTGSAWRYVIGALVISVGLFAVIFITDRLNKNKSS